MQDQPPLRLGGHATHPVAQVGDAGGFDHADELELDVVGAEVLEQPPSLAQQDRDQVDLQLVEHAGAQERLREVGAVDHDVLVAGGLLGLPHGALDAVGDVVDELGGGLLGRLAARGHEDRDPVVVVAVPVAGVVEGAPADDHRSGRHRLRRRPSALAPGGRKPDGPPIHVAEPLVQALAAEAEPVRRRRRPGR